MSLFVVGVAIYARVTRALRARGIVAFWLLVVVVSISYVGAIFGPPPPSVDMIKYVGLTVVAVRGVGVVDRPQPRDARQRGGAGTRGDYLVQAVHW